MAYAQGSKLRLNATTEGIGPIFKIKLEIQNLSKKTMVNTKVMLTYDKDIYRVINKTASKSNAASGKVVHRPEGSYRFDMHPLLLPNLNYNQEIFIENIDENGAADLIKVIVFNDKSTVPLITANLNMPLSEVDLE